MLAVEICSDTSGRGEDPLRVAYPVILDKDHLDLAFDGIVMVDYFRHAVDELNDLLGFGVAGAGLCAEDKGSGIEGHLRMAL